MQVEELLRQLTGPGYLELDDHSRHERWQRLRELARQRLNHEDLAALAAADRVRGQLLLAGQPEAFRRFALAELAIRATTRCHSADWRPEGLEVMVTGVLDRPGDPLFELADARVLLRVPETTPLPVPVQLDVTSEATSGSVSLVLQEEGNDAHTQESTLVAGPGALAFDESHTRLGFEVRLAIDPGQLPSGRWHSYLRITSCGWTVRAPLDLAEACPSVAVLSGRRFATPVARPLGLVISDTLPPAALPVARGATGSTDVRVTRTGTHLRIGLDLALHAIADVTGTRIPLRLIPESNGSTDRATGPRNTAGSARQDPGTPVAGAREGGTGTARTEPLRAEQAGTGQLEAGELVTEARLVCGTGGIGMLEAIVPAHRLRRPGRYAFWVDGARLGVDLVLDADGRARALAPPALTVVGATDREFGDDLEWVPELGRARGEYVVFGLRDAEISDQTLTTLARYGRQHAAEIVLVRHPEATDPYDRPRTDIGADPSVLGHGVPGSLYARRLLVRVGLDPAVDHSLVFDALAHVHAESIAVLGAASEQLDPRELVRLPRRSQPSGPHWRAPLAELESAFATLLDRTEPGPRRDAVLLRWLDEQLVARLRGESLLSLDPDRRAALVAAVRRIIDTYCPDQVPELAPVPRMVAGLAALADVTGPGPSAYTGDDTPGPKALSRFAAWERDLRVAEDRNVELGWQPDSVLRVSAGFRLEGALTSPTGPPAMLLGETGTAHPLAHIRARLLLCDDHGAVRFAADAAVRPRPLASWNDAGPGTEAAGPADPEPHPVRGAEDGDGNTAHEAGHDGERDGAHPEHAIGSVVPGFDVWASADLGSVAGRTLPPGVWQLRFRVDCLGVTRHLNPTARSVDLPGGERRSRASARFPDQYFALAVGIDVDGSVELLRVPAPYVRAKGPLRRLIQRFSPQRTHTRRNS